MSIFDPMFDQLSQIKLQDLGLYLPLNVRNSEPIAIQPISEQFKWSSCQYLSPNVNDCKV